MRLNGLFIQIYFILHLKLNLKGEGAEEEGENNLISLSKMREGEEVVVEVEVNQSLNFLSKIQMVVVEVGVAN